MQSYTFKTQNCPKGMSRTIHRALLAAGFRLVSSWRESGLDRWAFIYIQNVRGLVFTINVNGLGSSVFVTEPGNGCGFCVAYFAPNDVAAFNYESAADAWLSVRPSMHEGKARDAVSAAEAALTTPGVKDTVA